MFVIILIYLTVNLLSSSETLQQNVCMSEKCIRAAAKILETIDQDLDPCADFYTFACGNFIKNAVIPDDRRSISTLYPARDKIKQQLKEMYEEPIKENDAHTLKLVKSVYSSCMDTNRNDKAGFGFMKNIFEDLGGWPVVVKENWDEKIFDWANAWLRLQEFDDDWSMFFLINVRALSRNSSGMLTIEQFDMTEFGLDSPEVKDLHKYLVDLAMLFGADQKSAAAEMEDVINLEIDLSKIIAPREEREFKKMTIAELQKKFPSIPWLQLINSYLSPFDKLTPSDVVNLNSAKFFQGLEELLEKYPKRTLANHMFSKFLRHHIDFMPEKFQNAYLAYFREIYNDVPVSRWISCMQQADRLSVAVASNYFRIYFSNNTKHEVAKLASNVKDSLIETLKDVDWMDPITKNQALIKAERIRFLIGFPDELDEKKAVEFYKGLELDQEAYFLRLSKNITQFLRRKNIEELRIFRYKNNWNSLTFIRYLHSYYNQNENLIELPGAILQEIFFDSQRPQYLNYGWLGKLIGQGAIHGFYDRGKDYDQDGNLRSWWQMETNETFSQRSECLQDQYLHYTQEAYLLSEDIADNAAIKIAYKAYLKWLEENKEEMILPGLPYTGRQLFWISSATSLCTKHKEKKSIMNKLAKLRGQVPFINSGYMARDFKCPLGSTMNPTFKCPIW